ncbi:hypothetical protein BN159_1968 [Streptomyces davaonensis JCM 4913]|uniref:Integral membrane protein n=1 Tax=Streptomyces davaonensis (strain DSM 101723 / JCM 4913 / KCC S-0913 / 768) TaxID=1214101 RepID=K4QZM2_STRDJ|nr:hypothetical protein [Streptomyces davaonensis]CCK26347.1 hypothetical protein BN159_1968 [Streptomyces davaonensis JCM 4913]
MERGHERLATPWAAGVAGVVFAILMAAAIVLVRLALPDGDGDAVTVDAGQRGAVRVALTLLPFAGIAFLWFMGALREQAGEREDRFVATVFLGSGLIFVATLFGAAAAAGTVLDESRQQGSPFGRDFAYALLTTYAMRMAAVFIITTSTIGRRLGVLPRPLVVLGYLAGLTLLVVGADVPWSELVLPVWALLLSLHILRGRRPTPRT